jgi:histone-binding protein RBBP4
MDIEEADAIDAAAQARYRVWKKNAPYLYDYLSTSSLLWPLMLVQFFPDLEARCGADATEPSALVQRLLVGTFTLGQGADHISLLALPTLNLRRQLDPHRLHYSDRGEFEARPEAAARLAPLQRISHYGDVNRARYMPQNPDLIATANNMGHVVVYDRTKHPSLAPHDGVRAADVRLASAADTSVFALDWNAHRAGALVAALMGGHLEVWDVRRDYDSAGVAAAYTARNDDAINDAQWVPRHDALVAAVDERGTIKLWDTREAPARAARSHRGRAALNSVSVNPANPLYVAAGDAAGTIHVWDVRTSATVDEVKVAGGVARLKWHRTYSTVLAAAGADATVRVLDMALDEREVFVHGGHMLGVNDFDWSLHDDWLAASVADDNSLHVWKPAADIVRRYAHS